MPLPTDPTPPGHSPLDRLAYAAWAFVLAGVACFAVLDACVPCAPADAEPAFAATGASP